MSRYHPLIINSRQIFEALLEQYPELRLQKSFQYRYQAALSYFEGQMDKGMPSLVKKIEQKELARLYEEVHSGPPTVRIESQKDVLRLLEKYPEEKENNHFVKRYKASNVYFEVRDDIAHSQNELAEIHCISQQRVSEYLSGKEPTLISRLRKLEEQHLIEEWGRRKLIEVKINRDSSHQSYTQDFIGVIRIDDIQLERDIGFSLKDIVSLLHKLLNKLYERKTRIGYTTFEALDISKLHQFAVFLKKNHKKIMRELQTQTGLAEKSVRICITSRRLYLWTPNLTPIDVLNAWSNQWLYFNRCDFARIILMVGAKLEFTGSDYERLRHFKNLVVQLIPGEASNQIGLVDYRSGSTRVVGEVFRLQCDILGISPRNLEHLIEKVAGKNGHGGVLRPKLLQGVELGILLSRLGAVVNSDCWLGEDGRLQYTEADVSRIQIVQALFRYLGDIGFKLVSNKKDRSFKMWIPKPIGNAFIFWGFTVRDKSIQNERLVEPIRKGSVKSKIAYLEELIAEDGSFDPIAGFKWSRTVVLNPGIQDTKYHVQPKLSGYEEKFILNHEAARVDEKRKHIIVPILKIKNEVDSKIAQKIMGIIEKSRSQLLDDEAALAKELGIKILVYPESISLYERTKRISLKWVAKTKSKVDTIKWALLAPINALRKKRKVEFWLAGRPEEVARVRKDLLLI